MKFSERHKLEKEYKEWLEKITILNEPGKKLEPGFTSLIIFLKEKGFEVIEVTK